MARNPLLGTTHLCDACGYELLLGSGHHMDLAVCGECGADFVINYPGKMFARCTIETPGTLLWLDSNELKPDDRDNPVELRRDVLPLPGRGCLPDLAQDICPRCHQAGVLLLSLPEECVCPRCHAGTLREVGTWIQ